MRRKQEQLIQALERVEQFLESHPEVMDAVITSAAKGVFSASRARLAQHMRLQEQFARALRNNTGVKRVLRNDLVREHLRPISVVARTRFPDAGEGATFRLPTRATFLGSVAAGYGMAEAAKAHEQTFLAAGLPAGFIDRLVSATDLLKAALDTKGATNALRVEATAGLHKEGRVARNALRVLDALVRAAVRQDNALLDRWFAISRVARTAVTRAGVDDGAPDGSTTPPASSPGGDDASTSPGGPNPSLPEAPVAA